MFLHLYGKIDMLFINLNSFNSKTIFEILKKIFDSNFLKYCGYSPAILWFLLYIKHFYNKNVATT